MVAKEQSSGQGHPSSFPLHFLISESDLNTFCPLPLCFPGQSYNWTALMLGSESYLQSSLVGGPHQFSWFWLHPTPRPSPKKEQITGIRAPAVDPDFSLFLHCPLSPQNLGARYLDTVWALGGRYRRKRAAGPAGISVGS